MYFRNPKAKITYLAVITSGTKMLNKSSDPPPFWWVNPNDTDWLAWASIISLGLAFYLVVYLYAKFDSWAERKSEGTPLARTIPTMLVIALLYEVFPLDHFSILLPLSAILIALMADWMRQKAKRPPVTVNHETSATDPKDSDAGNAPAKPKPAPNAGLKSKAREKAGVMEIDPDKSENTDA